VDGDRGFWSRGDCDLDFAGCGEISFLFQLESGFLPVELGGEELANVEVIVAGIKVSTFLMFGVIFHARSVTAGEIIFGVAVRSGGTAEKGEKIGDHSAVGVL